jgi:hypothetical protein
MGAKAVGGESRGAWAAGVALSGEAAFVRPGASGTDDLPGSILGAAGSTAGEGLGWLSLRLPGAAAGRDAAGGGTTGTGGRSAVAGTGALAGSGRSADAAGMVVGPEATDRGGGCGDRSAIDAGRRNHINSPALARTTAAPIHIHH